MTTMTTMAFNGFEGKKLLNAHISYKGRSVIVDYEWCLHAYSVDGSTEYVPFEIYPYNGDDIFVGYTKLDTEFRYADMSALIKALDDALADENKE